VDTVMQILWAIIMGILSGVIAAVIGYIKGTTIEKWNNEKFFMTVGIGAFVGGVAGYQGWTYTVADQWIYSTGMIILIDFGLKAIYRRLNGAKAKLQKMEKEDEDEEEEEDEKEEVKEEKKEEKLDETKEVEKIVDEIAEDLRKLRRKNLRRMKRRRNQRRSPRRMMTTNEEIYLWVSGSCYQYTRALGS